MYLELKKSGEETKEEVKAPTLEPWRELLFEAATILERRGWCQKHLVDVKGRMCTVGAITEVWNLASGWDMDVVVIAQDKLTRVVGPLVEWNDTEGRTRDEVVGMLRYVAALSERRSF